MNELSEPRLAGLEHSIVLLLPVDVFSWPLCSYCIQESIPRPIHPSQQVLSRSTFLFSVELFLELEGGVREIHPSLFLSKSHWSFPLIRMLVNYLPLNFREQIWFKWWDSSFIQHFYNISNANPSFQMIYNAICLTR